MTDPDQPIVAADQVAIPDQLATIRTKIAAADQVAPISRSPSPMAPWEAHTRRKSGSRRKYVPNLPNAVSDAPRRLSGRPTQ